jgi:hypothetical protein
MGVRSLAALLDSHQQRRVFHHFYESRPLMAIPPKHIRVLRDLLDAETDPQKKAELATRLSRAEEAHGREKARRRRARRDKPEPPAPRRDDSADIFRLCDCPIEGPCTCPPPQPPPAPVAVVYVPKPADESPKPEPVEPVTPDRRSLNGYGETRVIRAMNYPGAKAWNPVERRYDDDFEPTSSVGIGNSSWIFAPTRAAEIDAFSGGKFQSEREAEEREAERKLTWDEQCQRASEAAKQGRWR